MSWPIDELLQEMASDHIRIMDLAGESESGREYHDMSTMQDGIGAHKYGPCIDEDEKNKVYETMDRKNEDEDVIRYRLQVTIQRVEGM